MYIYLYVCVYIYIYIPHLLYPFVCNGHLGCFPVFAVVNSTAMYMEVHIYFPINVFVFSGYLPTSEIASSWASPVAQQ